MKQSMCKLARITALIDVRDAPWWVPTLQGRKRGTSSWPLFSHSPSPFSNISTHHPPLEDDSGHASLHLPPYCESSFLKVLVTTTLFHWFFVLSIPQRTSHFGAGLPTISRSKHHVFSDTAFDEASSTISPGTGFSFILYGLFSYSRGLFCGVFAYQRRCPRSLNIPSKGKMERWNTNFTGMVTISLYSSTISWPLYWEVLARDFHPVLYLHCILHRYTKAFPPSCRAASTRHDSFDWAGPNYSLVRLRLGLFALDSTSPWRSRHCLQPRKQIHPTLFPRTIQTWLPRASCYHFLLHMRVRTII